MKSKSKPPQDESKYLTDAESEALIKEISEWDDEELEEGLWDGFMEGDNDAFFSTIALEILKRWKNQREFSRVDLN